MGYDCTLNYGIDHVTNYCTSASPEVHGCWTSSNPIPLVFLLDNKSTSGVDASVQETIVLIVNNNVASYYNHSLLAYFNSYMYTPVPLV